MNQELSYLDKVKELRELYHAIRMAERHHDTSNIDQLSEKITEIEKELDDLFTELNKNNGNAD